MNSSKKGVVFTQIDLPLQRVSPERIAIQELINKSISSVGVGKSNSIDSQNHIGELVQKGIKTKYRHTQIKTAKPNISLNQALKKSMIPHTKSKNTLNINMTNLRGSNDGLNDFSAPSTVEHKREKGARFDYM